MSDLVEDLPEQAWLTNVGYQYPLEAAVGGTSGRQLTLAGSVIAASEAAEQDVAVRFKELLQRDDRFQKAFNDIEVSLQAGGADGSRTSFRMNCTGKHGG